MEKKKPGFANFVKKITVLFFGTVLMLALSACEQPKGDVESFAKCLTESGATMYGAYWCGHCSTQKKMFGDAIEYVDYVECTDEEGGGFAKCNENKIEGLPTWIMGDGTWLTGVQQFEKLAEKSGCEYNPTTE